MHPYLNPKALGLAAVALVLMAAMTVLGLWQFRVYDDHQRATAAAALRRPAVPLDALIGPDDAFPDGGVGRPVRATGRYLPAQQVYVRGLTGSAGRYAVATPLLTATGSAVLVVRGSSDRLGVPVPAGPIHLVGILEPSTAAGGTPDADGVIEGLSVASLVNTVHPDLYSAYLLLRTSTAAREPSLAPVPPPLPDPSRWSGVRNLFYACQWWLFALFVAFMWWRMIKDMEATQRAERRTSGSPSPQADRAAGAPPPLR